MSRHGKRRIGTADVTQHAVVSKVIGSLRVITGHLGTSSAKFFLNRFISDFYSRRQATVEQHWTRSLRFLSTELANAAFTRDGAEVAAMAAGTADTEHQGRAGRAPHPPRTGGAATARPPISIWSTSGGGRRPGASGGRSRSGSPSSPSSPPSSSSTTRWASSSPTSRPTVPWSRSSPGDRPSRRAREDARAVRLDGTPGRVDRARLPAQRRVHPHPGDAVPGHASRAGRAASSTR